MNIPIFEILILLFILFPFIKQLIDQLKGEQPKSPEQLKRERERKQQDPWENPEEYDWSGGQQEKKPDWEDAFRELEEIFTGKKEEPRREPDMPKRDRSKPKAEPKREKGPATATTTQHSEPFQLSENPYQADMPDFQHLDHESPEIGASNPIYNELLGSKREHKTSKAARQIRKTIQSPESLRAAFIFKEVLDKPGGRRRGYTRYS